MFDMQLLDRFELRDKLLGRRQQRRVVSNHCDERPLTRNEQVPRGSRAITLRSGTGRGAM
jgi:hypothetical protein